MVKPGGTGSPRLAISARPAPLPPRRLRASARSADLPPPNACTHRCDPLAVLPLGLFAAGLLVLVFFPVFTSGGFALSAARFGIAGWRVERSGFEAGLRPLRAAGLAMWSRPSL